MSMPSQSTTVALQTAAERVAVSLDLLSIILSLADKKDTLARSARVSKAWFIPAIRNLWVSVYISNLFSLLPKRKLGKDGQIISYVSDFGSLSHFKVKYAF